MYTNKCRGKQKQKKKLLSIVVATSRNMTWQVSREAIFYLTPRQTASGIQGHCVQATSTNLHHWQSTKHVHMATTTPCQSLWRFEPKGLELKCSKCESGRNENLLSFEVILGLRMHAHHVPHAEHMESLKWRSSKRCRDAAVLSAYSVHGSASETIRSGADALVVSCHRYLVIFQPFVEQLTVFHTSGIVLASSILRVLDFDLHL